MSNIKSLDGFIALELEQNKKEAQRQRDQLRWQELLDWQKIHDWASAKPAGTVLGESCTNTTCPLAEYLNDATGLTLWSVGLATIKCGDGRSIKLKKPGFVDPLLVLVDESGKQTDEIEPQDVTRERFLHYLEAVKQEHEEHH